MKNIQWTFVKESKGFDKLPAGGYVLKIVDCVDVPEREYLSVVYDIAEGEHAGEWSDQWGKDHPYAHEMKRSYKQTAYGMFKQFLARLEDSNVDFKIEQWEQTSDERALVGLIFGGVIQYEDYTYNGEDKERKNVFVYSADDIRKGNFKVPERKDSREKADEPVAAAPAEAYDDVPF